MKKRAKRYLTAISLVSLLLLASLSVFWVSRQSQAQAVDTLENYLDSTVSLADIPQDPDGFVKDLSRSYSGGVRITLLDAQGNVLGDSQSDPATMENHANREEIAQALASGRGQITRYSQTTGTSTVYLAKPWGDGYVLRFAMPVSEARDMATGFILPTLFTILVMGAVIASMVDRLAGNITKPFEAMLVYIERILRGEAGERPQVPKDDEFAPIVEYFHYLLDEISRHIKEVSAKTEEIQNIISSMEEGLVMLDSQWNILLQNRQAAKYLGIPIESWQRKVTYLYRDPAFIQAMEKAEEEGVRHIADIVREDRTYRYYINPVEEGGYVLLISDVSELVQLERIRSDFAANVSHELKTPLTSISGFAELIQAGMVARPEMVAEYAGKILVESRRLVGLIDDILDLSAIENAQMEELEPVDVRGLMGYVTEMLAPQLEEKGVTMTVSGQLWVRASRAHLYELAFNLCENGVKYNREGGSLSVELEPDGFTVTDTGIGIPKEHQQRIFERFYRVDKARSRKTGGTGLGLAIAKHVMALYGGSISVESSEAGSIFRVQFPGDLIFAPSDSLA